MQKKKKIIIKIRAQEVFVEGTWVGEVNMCKRKMISIRSRLKIDGWVQNKNIQKNKDKS